MKNKKTQEDEEDEKSSKVIVNRLIWLAVTIAALLPIIYGVQNWVENVAEKAVMKEEFLTKLATKVRPVCVFDNRERLLVSSGMDDYLESYSVNPKDELYGFEVKVNFKTHLKNAPILTCVDGNLTLNSAERGKMNEWIFAIGAITRENVVLTRENKLDTNNVYRFKLEVIP